MLVSHLFNESINWAIESILGIYSLPLANSFNTIHTDYDLFQFLIYYF